MGDADLAAEASRRRMNAAALRHAVGDWPAGIPCSPMTARLLTV